MVSHVSLWDLFKLFLSIFEDADALQVVKSRQFWNPDFNKAVEVEYYYVKRRSFLSIPLALNS